MQIDPRFTAQFPICQTYLVGVSGGRDSVALLHLLLAGGYRKLVVCHLDHRLRGNASDRDAKFVTDLAARLDLPCEIGRTDVRLLANGAGLSLETAARMARFAFFLEIARRRRCRKIFLAHHADDLVETALFNLFRGAGPGGFSALRDVSEHRVGRTTLTLIRPLLSFWRSEIDHYVRRNELAFREDASNARLAATRNKIRHQLLPLIGKTLARDVRKTIWRAAQIWTEEESFLESLLPQQTPAVLSVAALRKLPIALQRRTIHRWLRERKVSEIRFDQIESVRALLRPEAKVAKVNLARDQYARRRAGKVFIE